MIVFGMMKFIIKQEYQNKKNDFDGSNFYLTQNHFFTAKCLI